ncbi:SusC/RagA family TonB-linked outer membrane protein [Flavobacterium sp. SM15]|uniref:SusC/RagA family TonB-linked outer membrane protein n=1 Tax=Flavobacterium sp. SM15 TaxID=2908005 RepID=UPI001EDC75D0|nr:SusC/RagA family TonB-linked outer membrane protein [Flavobacterium sp. SM15]MCG2610607.1 SusC/RagA family TonB-linked outer membrane protein [Flavobacterium sp. SM15]
MRSKFKWIFALLLAFSMQFAFAQEKTVTGTVTEGGLPLPGVSVVVKGTTNGTQTDMDGNYSIKAKTGQVLVFSFIGMKESTATVGASSKINVTMSAETKQLTEVVVEGYRTTTKASTVVAQATVKAATIENRPNGSFVQTLQGQLAGVNISTGSGQPGSKSTVIIRGAGSVTGNTDPLYVIDGMPTNGDNFRTLNPNDIESTTVLKDAAATGIYGNRGANGVIVVKTKRGSFGEGGTKFRYSVNTGITQLQKSRYSFSNSKELLKLEQMYPAGLGATLTDAQIDAWSIDTDWVKEFFRLGTSADHQFSIENTGKNLSSYTSVNYFNQEGILTSTGLKRFSMRNNLTGKSANEKFTYSTNMFMGFSKNNEATNLGSGAINRNYVLGATLSAPYISPSQYQGSQQVFDLYQTDGTLLYTPLFLMDKLNTYVNNTDETRFIGSAETGYKLTKDLTFRTRTGTEMMLTRFNQSEHPISFNALLFKNAAAEFGGFEDINTRREFSFNNLFQLDYTKEIGKHKVNALLNQEYNFDQLNVNNMRQRGLDPKFFVPNTGSGYLADIASHDFYGGTVSANKLKRNLISYFGVLDYSFDNRYGVVGTYRFDGSSVFGQEKKWGEFWSVAGRWNIDKESFMQKQDLFQVLKLRASIGVNGNQRIVDGTIYAGLNPPAYIDTYANASNVYNGQSGYTVNFGVPDLHWEITKQYNFGLDFEMFHNRLRGNVDYYNKKGYDLLNFTPVSIISGTNGIIKNSGMNLTNKGWEVSLAGDVLKGEDYILTLRANGSYNKSEVNDIPFGEIYDGGNSINKDGHMLDEYYVIPYAGVNQANGELLFTAADGSLTENPSATADRVFTGKNWLPIYQGGFGFDAEYKGFFAKSTFTFAQKVWRYDFDLQGLYDPTSLGQFVVSNDLLNAWTPTNTNTNVPALNATNLGTADNSDRFLRDASYVRLRHAQIGYKVPKKFLDKTFITGLSFYAQGENLVTMTKWKGFDAESNRTADQAQYPTPRIYTFGIDLRF